MSQENSSSTASDSKPPTAKSQALRDRIRAQIDQAAEAHRQELFRHRIELARGGVRSYSMRRVPEAVKAFHTYIKILEDWKKVPEGGLNFTTARSRLNGTPNSIITLKSTSNSHWVRLFGHWLLRRFESTWWRTSRCTRKNLKSSTSE